MTPTLRICEVDPRARSVAEQLHAVQMLAYAQEAALLGAIHFPPLERTVEDLQAAAETFHAAYFEDQLAGAISVEREAAGPRMNIASLVVAPAFQRRGVGARLLATVVQLHGEGDMTVQTGVKNLPALSVYRGAGFVEVRRWLVGREPLELVQLLRTANQSSPEGRNAT